MDPNIKAQWVAALRSGEYRQGKSVLHSADTGQYCCLGVLCDLAVKAGAIVPGRHEYNSDADADIEVYGVDGHRQGRGGVTLPDEVVAWAGLEDDSPNIYMVEEDGEEYPQDLTELNDDHEYTFVQLADLIEEQL